MIGTFVIAAAFYGIAEYEQMTGWKWAAASVAVTYAVMNTVGFMLAVLPAQVALFGVLWWQNAKRLEKLPEEQAARVQAMQLERQERVRLAHEEVDRKRSRPDS